MHISTHHHDDGISKALEHSTRGWIMNLGWRYDLMVSSIDILLGGKLRNIRTRTVDLAQLRSGEAVLDVGCGTGVLAKEAYKRVGVTGRVCGIDPGIKQIARARSQAQRAHLPIDFQLGVIEQLAFPDRTFDVVFSTFMMHHLPDDLKRLGLAEIARVLKPGGRLVIADFKRSEKEQSQPAQLGAGSLGQQDLANLLKEAGFSQIESGDLPFPRLMGMEGAGFVRGSINP